MNFDLEEHHIAIQRMVRDFAEKEIAPIAQEMDEREQFPTDIIRKMGELGIMGLPFPEKYGGSGADVLSYVIALEELARVDSSVAITLEVCVSLVGLPLLQFGTEEQKKRWLVPLAGGEMIASFGLTEPGSGSDAGGMKTRAVKDGNEWVINGSKSFITNSGTPISGFVIVACVTGEKDGRAEVSNIIVPRGTLGYVVGKPYRKIGWHASDTHELYFNDCRVPSENLLGEEGKGFAQFLWALDAGRVGISALGVGLAQACLDHSLKRAKERVQFGQPISQFQVIQFKLADMAMNVDMARLATYRAAMLMQQGKPFKKEASIAKLFSSEMAVRAAEEAVQIFGGYGYINESPVARFYRDSKILTIGEGTSEVQRMIIARELGC